VGYLSKILNARVYDAAKETELQHAKNLSAVRVVENGKVVDEISSPLVYCSFCLISTDPTCCFILFPACLMRILFVSCNSIHDNLPMLCTFMQPFLSTNYIKYH